MRILVTGGAGFIGHHFVEHIIKNTDWEVVVLDKLSYATPGFDRLRDINLFTDKRVFCLTHDFTKSINAGIEKEIGQVDYVVHMGAETSVDKSIEIPWPFVLSNVLGTMHVLEFAKRQKNLRWFVMFSTDEVFGPAPPGVQYKEWDRYNCTNPYAATKAGAEQLALAYANTYKIPTFIVNTMNVFGERQHPEKFIPLILNKLSHDQEILIHADSTKTIPGSRFWIHARNVSDALLFLLKKAEQRQRYNLVGEQEIDNLEMLTYIAKILSVVPKYKLVDFHSSRPGHDLRYALDGTKMRSMGWYIPKTFKKSLEKTIRWYLDGNNNRWLTGGHYV